MKPKAIFPGTFDPVTNGHLDIIRRAAVLFPEVIVAVAENTQKSPRYSLKERTDFIRASISDLPNVSVQSFAGLMVDFARQVQATVVVRSLRSVVDYEFELQLSRMNHHLYPTLETIFLVPSTTSSFISSTLIREVSQLGGDVTTLVPPIVAANMREKHT